MVEPSLFVPSQYSLTTPYLEGNSINSDNDQLMHDGQSSFSVVVDDEHEQVMTPQHPMRAWLRNNIRAPKKRTNGTIAY